MSPRLCLKTGPNSEPILPTRDIMPIHANLVDVLARLELGHASKPPAHCLPWVFMDEMPNLLPLVLVDVNATFHILFRSLKMLLVLQHPSMAALVHQFLETLADTKK